MCTFFVANAYFQIKTNETKVQPVSDNFFELQRKEESTYERAKILRKELLREAHNKAELLMSKVNEKVYKNSLVNIPKIPPLKGRGGIESRAIFEKVEHMIAIMQTQASHIDEWRDKTIELLLLTLVDEEEADLQGDEYETSTKRQDEVLHKEPMPKFLTITDFKLGLCICRRSEGPHRGSSRHFDRPGQ